MISRLFLATILGLSFIPSIFAGLSFGFPYGSQKVRGVNLGGWLVLEAWLTPSLFDATGDPRIVDEWTFCQYQDRTTATNALTRHWDTFITESDFAAIAAAGLNHVRIPIGYWAYDVQAPEPFIQGQLPYLTKAIDWARKYNLKVIIDLHGAPGSQNGFDNSGQQTYDPKWYRTPSYVKRTNAVVARIAQTYKDMSGVVTMIQPLNEPASWYGNALDIIRQFYYDSYGAIRWSYGTSRLSNTIVFLGDAFMSTSYWRNFMPYPNWDGVIMDRHIYQIFSDAETRLTRDQHIQSACSRAADMTGATLWQIVGEWSPAATDCAIGHMFFSRSGGSRYENLIGSCAGLSGKSSTFSADYKTFLRKYWEAQVITYEKAQGWLMWTWKAENADDWSYQAGLAGGWIPQNPAERKYPNICG